MGDNRTSDSEEGSESLLPGELEDFQEDERILVPQEIQNNEAVNDLVGMAQKLAEIRLTIPGESVVPWIETCVINTPMIDTGIKLTDDLELEKKFYNSARFGVLAAFEKMRELDIPRDRPTDYFAEMIKEDTHMEKVKKALLKEKKSITDKQLRTKKRIESKFMKTAQKTAEEQKTKAKKEETDALRKWRKLRKRNQVTDDDVPEELFDPNSQLRKQLAGYKRGRLSERNPRKDKGSRSASSGGKNARGRSASGGGNFSNGKEGGKDRGRSASSGGQRGNNTSGGKSFSRKGSKKAPNRPGKRKRQQARASQGKSKRNRK